MNEIIKYMEEKGFRCKEEISLSDEDDSFRHPVDVFASYSIDSKLISYAYEVTLTTDNICKNVVKVFRSNMVDKVIIVTRHNKKDYNFCQNKLLSEIKTYGDRLEFKMISEFA